MFKSIGLGIACLTLTISGVTRATPVSVDCGKYGDDKCIKVEKDCTVEKECTPLPADIQFLDVGNKDCNKDIDKDCTKDICKDDNKDCVKDLCDLKIKPVVDCDDHKDCDDGKDTCKVDLCDTHEPVLCDIGDKDKDHGCDLVIDGCSNNPCGHDDHGDCTSPTCEPTPPAAVPAPASAAFGGLGVAGIMLVAGLRSRRSAAL
jgi:hypothetical protein